MATGVFIWNRTAASNATADSAINWSEGQSPSSVNDSARAMMAKIAEFRDDTAGALTTTGTSTAYVIDSYQAFDSLANMNGKRISVKFHATNGAAPTLNVETLGAKAIQTLSGTAVPTGAIRANTIWDLVYDNSASAWILIGVPFATFFASNTLSPSAVAFSATQRLLGRYTASGGAGEEISLGTGILLSGAGVLSAASSAGLQIINGTIAEANATNAVTYSLKTLAGTDPSASDPVYLIFRNVTAGTGNYVVRTVTAATSLTISAGSNLGVSVNNTPFNVWLVFFDDAGTIRMGAIQCLSGTDIFQLGRHPIASSTAEGGAGGADSAQVFYTGTAVTSKPYIVAAYAYYASGLATAGNWNVSPDIIELWHPGIPLPDEEIKRLETSSGSVATGTTLLPFDNTTPGSAEGDQYLSKSHTPQSAATIVEIEAQLTLAHSADARVSAALFQDTTCVAVAPVRNSGTNLLMTYPLRYAGKPATASAITWSIRAGCHAAGTTTLNGESGAGLFNGLIDTRMEIIEKMA